MDIKRILVPTGYLTIKDDKWVLTDFFVKKLKDQTIKEKMIKMFSQPETEYILKLPALENDESVDKKTDIYYLSLDDCYQLFDLFRGSLLIIESPDPDCKIRIVGSDYARKLYIRNLEFRDFYGVNFINFNVSKPENGGFPAIWFNNIKGINIKQCSCTSFWVKKARDDHFIVKGINNNQHLHIYDNIFRFNLDIGCDNSIDDLLYITKQIGKNNKKFNRNGKWDSLTTEEQRIIIYLTMKWLWPSDKPSNWEISFNNRQVLTSTCFKDASWNFINVFEKEHVLFEPDNQNENNTSAASYLLNSFVYTANGFGKGFPIIKTEGCFGPIHVVEEIYNNLKYYTEYKRYKKEA